VRASSSNVASLCNICHFLSHYLFDTIFNLFKRITSSNKKSLQNNDATLQVLGLNNNNIEDESAECTCIELHTSEAIFAQ
jgi:hypothetical protein